MNYFIYEITDKSSSIIYSNGDTVKNKIYPRIKTGALYPYCKAIGSWN